MTNPYAVSDDRVLDAVDAAIEDGRRDLLSGGVAPETVAEYCALKEVTLKNRLADLAKAGDLVKVHGAAPTAPYPPRRSYLPSDHPDARSMTDTSDF